MNRIVLLITTVSMALLGISTLLMGHHSHISRITDFYGLTEILPPPMANALAGIGFLLIAGLALFSLIKSININWLAYSIITLSIVPLVALFGDNMWIESLGGFPAIGAGQGVIKYFALLAIGLTLLNPNWLNTKARTWLNLFPVLLVLLWIGGMKFTLLEAQGIEPLVQSSVFMAWMYAIWDLQTTSNLIGVYDLLAVALLVLSVFVPRVRLIAFAMAGAVFVVTQTFLVSFSPSLSATTLLTSTGHFLIKDLWFIANMILAWGYLTQGSMSTESFQAQTHNDT